MQTDSARIRGGLVLLMLAGSSLALWPVVGASQREWKQRRTAALLESHSFSEANLLAKELLSEDPQSDYNNLLMAESLAGLGRSEDALTFYERVSSDDPLLQLETSFGKGARQFAVGRVRKAEHFFKETLTLDPQHFEACRKMAFLMRVQGRVWESMTPVRQQIAYGVFRGDQLHMLGSQRVIVDNPDFVSKCLAAVPGDPLPRLGEAQMYLFRNRDLPAETLLKEIAQSAPGVVHVQAGLGELLVNQQRDAEFLAWNQSLPPNADLHPQIWYVRGQFLARKRRTAEAARCFIEALIRSPNHVPATYLLSQALRAEGSIDLAQHAADHATKLATVELTMTALALEASIENMEKAATQLAEAERFWEAAAMCHIVIEAIPSKQLWAEVGLRKYLALLTQDKTFEPGAIPVAGLQAEDFPLPQWSTASAVSNEANELAQKPSDISFVENADDVGLKFQYFNGSLKPNGLEHIFETTGGGVAVLDLDSDRWPDVWLAQGSAIWSGKSEAGTIDRIFRNIDGTEFEDATGKTGVIEDGFSQGVAVGDINSDGFPDVYVGNVGPNRLLLNNGDGTFTDVTSEADVGGDEWTLSPVIVDLNRDGFPEIYSLNYLQRDEVLARRCRKDGVPLTCAPTMFNAEQDRLFQNRGDGRFSEVTQSSGIVREGGNGLGIVAADFDQSGKVSLFIGNDTTNNFFFQNQTSAGGSLLFTEESQLKGLACDGMGKAQATMGIAVDDCDGDGQLDLFITNFYGDANTLFQSDGPGIWTDTTRASGLFDSSVELLGFGSQFLDADLDGWPDLIVTNGHVDRSDATGEPDQMRPQFYRNLSGRFDELSSATVGPFFAGEHLGRALSKLDWNRDGKPDCCISHLFTPAALLTNTSTVPGNMLRVRLIGVTVDRDAVGTHVTVEADGRKWTKQITMGNGYESTNEHILTFGLGSVDQVSRVTIDWTSGKTTVLTDLPVNAETTAIEGGTRWTSDMLSP